MSRAFTFLLVLLAGSLPATGLSQENDESRDQADLALVEQVCTQCHDLYPLFSQRKTRAGWRQTADRMIWRGAQLMPGESERVAGYLARNFGPDSPPPVASHSAAPGDDLLPSGAGKRLLLDSCVQCHDLTLIVSQRKTRDEWRRSVDNMIRLGTRLSRENAQTIVEYLSAHFAREGDAK